MSSDSPACPVPQLTDSPLIPMFSNSSLTTDLPAELIKETITTMVTPTAILQTVSQVRARFLDRLFMAQRRISPIVYLLFPAGKLNALAVPPFLRWY